MAQDAASLVAMWSKSEVVLALLGHGFFEEPVGTERFRREADGMEVDVREDSAVCVVRCDGAKERVMSWDEAIHRILDETLEEATR